MNIHPFFFSLSFFVSFAQLFANLYVSPVPPIQSPDYFERRVAFDIGSDQIKMQISDIDLIKNKIINSLFTECMSLQLRENIATSLDGCLNVKMQNKAIEVISVLMTKARQFHPQSHFAVATEALRLAKNSEDIVVRIKNETGLSLKIISKEEEGILGFISALHESDVDPRKAVCWEFGGGSSQITVVQDDQYEVYQVKLGKVPMKHLLLSIQGKDGSKLDSPNPISEEDLEKAVQYIHENIEEISPLLHEKLQNQNCIVLGRGINPLWGMADSAQFDQERVYYELCSRLNLSDKCIELKDEILQEYVPYRVSNLVFAYGMMKVLNIQNVKYVGSKGENAVGLLISPQYWKKN